MQRLAHLDPATAARLHPHDTYRIIRALEVMEATGRPLSEFIEAHRFQDAPYRVLKLGLNSPGRSSTGGSNPGGGHAGAGVAGGSGGAADAATRRI